MWLRIADIFSFACVPRVQVLYRKNNNSMSSNVCGIATSAISILKRNLEISPKLEAEIGKRNYADKYRFLAFKAIESQPRPKIIF